MLERMFFLLPVFFFLLATSQGLAAEVEIIRDDWGIPHIYADSMAGAAFGLGYAHSEDNLDGVLEPVVSARGESAKYSGEPKDLERDFQLRAFGIPTIARRLYKGQPVEIRAVLDGYAAGVNRYLKMHPKRKPDWFDRMTGLDEMALMKWYQFQQGLTVARTELRAILPESGRRPEPNQQEGSNMWAVGPARSKDGDIMLMSDPHLPWSGLTQFYEQQLIVGDRWLYGASAYGFFVTVVGFTPDVAWGSTNNAADIADVYEETIHPEDPNRYRYDGGWRDVEIKSIAIEVRGKGRVVRQVQRTHHGPIIRRDPANRKAYAVRLAGLEQTGLAALVTGYFRAGNVRQHLNSNSQGDHFKWHRIAIDRHGDMAYTYFSATHKRDDRFNWRRPVDGSIRDTEWGPRIPWDELPRMINPPAGYIVNCNNNPYTNAPDSPIQPAGFPAHLANQETRLRTTTRAYRANELIAAIPSLTFEDMERISMDVKAVNAEPYLQALFRAFEREPALLSKNPRVKRALEILKGWDQMATVENKAVPILTTFAEVAGEIQQTGRDGPEVVRSSFVRAVELMQQRWGGVEVPQGQIHVLKRGDLVLPLAGAGNQRASNPFVTLYMTGARKMEGGQWIADQGSSWMMLVRYRRGQVTAKTVLPWGNTENPTSPHYNDQARLFARRRYKQPALVRAQVEARASSRIILNW